MWWIEERRCGPPHRYRDSYRHLKMRFYSGVTCASFIPFGNLEIFEFVQFSQVAALHGQRHLFSRVISAKYATHYCVCSTEQAVL